MTRRGRKSARLGAPRRHRFPGARRDRTPTGGRRERGTPQLPGDAGGRCGLGGLILKEAGREGSSGFSAVCFSLPQLGGYRLFPKASGAQATREAAYAFHPPPSEPRHPPGARLSRTTAGHHLHAPRHVGACTTTCGRGKGARGRRRPDPTRSRYGSPQPLAPAPLTRVGFDVLPQEVATGEMLETKALSDPLAHGALARAGRPKDDRAQEFGSHCLRQAGRGRPHGQPGQRPRRSPGNFMASASASDTLRSRGDSPGAPAGGRSDF